MGAAPIEVKFTGFSGVERTMHVRHLGHREFFETLHLAITVGARAFKQKGDDVNISLFNIIQDLEFSTFEKLAIRLLKGALFEGIGQIDDPFEIQHFRDNPDELYLATYNALTALHPDLYLKIKAEMERRGAASAPQNAAEQAGE